MTVKEMKEMIANMNDNDEVVVMEIKTAYNDPFDIYETKVKRYKVIVKTKEEIEQERIEEEEREKACYREIKIITAKRRIVEFEKRIEECKKKIAKYKDNEEKNVMYNERIEYYKKKIEEEEKNIA